MPQHSDLQTQQFVKVAYHYGHQLSTSLTHSLALYYDAHIKQVIMLITMHL